MAKCHIVENHMSRLDYNYEHLHSLTRIFTIPLKMTRIIGYQPSDPVKSYQTVKTPAHPSLRLAHAITLNLLVLDHYSKTKYSDPVDETLCAQ